MGNVMNAPDLAGLIADAKGDRSYDAISRACGGKPTPERLHQLATQPIKNFPGPDTIAALARGLGRTVTDVVAAASRSLGLEVQMGSDPMSLTLPTAGTLPSPAQEALREVARQMLSLHQVGLDAEESDGDGNAAAKTQGPEGPAPDNVTTLHADTPRPPAGKIAARPRPASKRPKDS
jgi:hypothetical protein